MFVAGALGRAGDVLHHASPRIGSTMNLQHLDDLLRREARRSLPPAPDLRAPVRIEIARRSGRSFWARLLPVLHWHELVFQPQVTAIALAIALVAGVLPGVAVSHVSSARDEARRARSSLHLQAFSLEQASLPWVASSPASQK